MRTNIATVRQPPQDDEVEVRCILRVPGEPDKPVVARMPRRAVPKKKGTK